MKAYLSTHLPIIGLLLYCSAVCGFSQVVSQKQGNIYFTAKDGPVTQLTTSALDSDPSLSMDGQLVAFVRRTPSLLIMTGHGEVDNNELWITPISELEPPRRVLVGHPGGFDQTAEIEDFVLAGFYSPQFSPDSNRLYFLQGTWATSNAILVLDLRSGKARFLCAGLSVEVITSGRFRGYLIANKEIPRVVPPARVFRYWLLDSDGKEVGEIGEEKSDVEEFKNP